MIEWKIDKGYMILYHDLFLDKKMIASVIEYLDEDLYNVMFPDAQEDLAILYNRLSPIIPNSLSNAKNSIIHTLNIFNQYKVFL